jgi:hypothetical protein
MRLLFFMMAAQILNLSIDFDYLRCNRPCLSAATDFDDVDSISELVIEKIAGSTSYTSENDDDSGQDKGIERVNSIVLYVDPVLKTAILLPKVDSEHKTGWAARLDQPAPCEGFFNIICPPPEA